MHPFTVPDHVMKRVLLRCGTPHPFADLDPKRTALIVIDMQNGYMREDVGHSAVKMAAEIVPTLNRLAASVRQAGGGVFWVQNATTEESRREWSVLEEQASPERRAARIRSVSPGTEGHELWSGLDIRSQDKTVPKYRYSAFIDGASDLETQLRAKGYDTLLITGTLTNVCCESSARDAMMLNFRTIMVSDGNAAMTDEEHAASLISFYLAFGDVMTSKEVESSLARGRLQGAA
jgi:nicotinamidase-related amidase